MVAHFGTSFFKSLNLAFILVNGDMDIHLNKTQEWYPFYYSSVKVDCRDTSETLVK